ncbi:MAG TPA: NAD(P)/FAD-dependent oxidoreductase [Gaiellaceae bacterium]|nr:NAD(P)/FAD-dependent oxidoreductase [Gaiellaceae bacterium]
MIDQPDAIVVGSGPNGLAAAIAIARAGHSVLVLEAAETAGGGMRSAELTLPGFVHDVCSAIHPWPLASPFLRTLPLAEHGAELIHPPAPLAHPFDDGTAAVLERSVDKTGATLGVDGRAYVRLMGPFVRSADRLLAGALGPALPPRHPLALARLGRIGIGSAAGLARSRFEGEKARGLFAGMAAHSMLSLRAPISAAFGIMLGAVGHAYGWPLVRGGSQRLADSLVSYLASLGGEVVTERRVESLEELPPTRAVLLDLTPRGLAQVAGSRLPARYLRRLARYRYGPGVFKIDWALAGPVPWTASECTRAATVHLGATLDEIVASEDAVARGEHPDRPYVLLAQQSLFDPSRVPDGKHTLWGYCHVPNGSTADMTEAVERQVERFAPGFRDLVLARSVMGPAEVERYNPNYVGGDINGGLQDLRQLFARPAPRIDPYSTPAPGVYICSSSTPPGGGVHGMCGYFAARSALSSLGGSS